MSIEIEPTVLCECSYAVPGDMVKRFGLSEVLCITDKEKCGTEAELCPGNPSYDRLICALNDAHAILNQKLCCCFDMKQICKWIAEGKKFPMLNFWQVTVARYLLHDVVSFSGAGKDETEQYKRYKQILKDIDSFCDPHCCTVLVDKTGECCLEKVCKVGFAVAKRKKSCIPDICCKKCGCEKNPGCACASINCDKELKPKKVNSYIGGTK